jgi:hypothetical protein
MEPDEIDHIDLYAYARKWARARRSWFPRWAFNDTVHEAFLVSCKKLQDYDCTKGNRWTFLEPRLFEPVWRKYCAMTGKRIDRTKVNGRWMRRKIVPIEVQVHPLPEVPVRDKVYEGLQIPHLDGPAGDLADLLMRGLSLKYASRVRGTSQSASSCLLRRMRKEWTDRRRDPH